MAIVQSRVRNGELTFTPPGTGATAVSFACQQTTVTVNPSYDDDGDAVETLCGDAIAAGKRESWTIAGTTLQDFDDPAGFQAFCYNHAMETVGFTWTPNNIGTSPLTWTGQCVVLALTEGGDVNARLDTDWEFDCVGRPVASGRTGLTPITQLAGETTSAEPAPAY